MSKLDAFFKFKENNTDVKTEIIAGITIFSGYGLHINCKPCNVK